MWKLIQHMILVEDCLQLLDFSSSLAQQAVLVPNMQEDKLILNHKNLSTIYDQRHTSLGALRGRTLLSFGPSTATFWFHFDMSHMYTIIVMYCPTMSYNFSRPLKWLFLSRSFGRPQGFQNSKILTGVFHVFFHSFSPLIGLIFSAYVSFMTLKW